MLSAILGTVAVVSAGINLWQWWAAGRFPLHRRISKPTQSGTTPPGATLLKPLKGADEETRGCLESWFTQDYSGPVQILFGVADANDPVCEIVRDLQRQFPERDSQLIVCDPILGANAKVSTLTYLQREAKHPFWIISDADVFAPPELLTEMIPKFEPADVALVNCFYKLSPAKTMAMIWENIGANADFWSQVCQSNSLKPMNFALGAVMGVRRGAIEMIDGFKPLLNQLADDYQLGKRLADSGRKIELCNIVVECREHEKGFVEVWKHQLRWARTIRVCQPGPYFASILNNTTVWSLLWIAITPLNNIAPLCLIVRTVTAIHNEFRLTRRFADALESLFTFAKDILQFVVWLCAFTGNTVVWRGEKFLVKRGGELVRIQG
jgi:ceramide glucosyltransferase